MNVKGTFDTAAESYDMLRRKLIPCFDDFYGMAVDLLSFDPSTPVRILDLGAGTGILAEQVGRRLPGAELTLLDFSVEMLSRARARFSGSSERVTLKVGNYVHEPFGGPWDAIVSALSIHHLQDPEKRALYAKVFDALVPGGIFVNADKVLAEDPGVQARDHASWMQQIRASGLAKADIDAALERTRVDTPAPLSTQLAWLREIGFSAVDCAYKWRYFAVFSGCKNILPKGFSRQSSIRE